jgi:hypothetical protein
MGLNAHKVAIDDGRPGLPEEVEGFLVMEAHAGAGHDLQSRLVQ